MIYLKKYTFLILVIFLAAIFAFIIPRSAQATHLNFSCFSAGHTDSVCASPAELGSSAFCLSVDSFEACVFDPDFNAFFNTACTDCEAFGSGFQCDDTTFGCVGPASTPTPTPTTAPSCSSFTSCSDCVLGGPTCGWAAAPGASGFFCESGTSACDGRTNWYFFGCSLNQCAAPPTPTPTPTPTLPPLTVTVSVTNTPSSGTAPLDSFTTGSIGGTATGAWTATRTCGGGSTPAETKTGSGFIVAFTPCTFTSGGNYSVSVDVTRQGVLGTGIALVTVTGVAATPTVGPLTPTPIPPTPTPTTAPGLNTVSGTVFIDDGTGGGTADNCAKDGAEAGYPNTTGGTAVQILETGAFTITGAFGDYSFNNLASGTYTVQLTAPSGYRMSSCNIFQKPAGVPPSPAIVNFFIVPLTIATPTPTGTPTPVPTAGPTPTPTSAPIVAPTAKFTITASGMIATATDQSTAGSNPIETWLWDFNDDGTWDIVHTNLLPPPPIFPFDYSNFGLVGTKTYTARLTVNNKDGSSSDFKSITVVGPLPPLCVTGEIVTDKDGNKSTKCTAVDTAIGSISAEPSAFVSRIMSLLLGISGGIAVLLIILAGYTLMTSRDKPEAIQDTRQRLMGAIVGLLFVALALVILQVIGVDILHIPGFEP